MAIIDNGGAHARRATSADVIEFYRTCLGREPENEGAIIGRLGRLYDDVHDEICFSEEAMARMRPVGPVGPIGPPPPPKPPADLPPHEVAGAIGGAILQRALDALTSVQQVSDSIRDEAEKRVREAIPGVSEVVDQIQAQIGNFTKGLIPSTLSLVGAALGGMENLLATFLSSAADVGDIADVFVNAVAGNKEGIGDFVMDLVLGDNFDLAGELGKKIADALVPGDDGVFEASAIVVGMMPEPRQVDI